MKNSFILNVYIFLMSIFLLFLSVEPLFAQDVLVERNFKKSWVSSNTKRQAESIESVQFPPEGAIFEQVGGPPVELSLYSKTPEKPLSETAGRDRALSFRVGPYIWQLFYNHQHVPYERRDEEQADGLPARGVYPSKLMLFVQLETGNDAAPYTPVLGEDMSRYWPGAAEEIVLIEQGVTGFLRENSHVHLKVMFGKLPSQVKPPIDGIRRETKVEYEAIWLEVGATPFIIVYRVESQKVGGGPGDDEPYDDYWRRATLNSIHMPGFVLSKFHNDRTPRNRNTIYFFVREVPDQTAESMWQSFAKEEGGEVRYGPWFKLDGEQ